MKNEEMKLKQEKEIVTRTKIPYMKTWLLLRHTKKKLTNNKKTESNKNRKYK